LLTYIGKAFKNGLPTRITAEPITTPKATDYHSRLPRKRRPRRRRRRLGLPAQKKKVIFKNTFAITIYVAFYDIIDEIYKTFPPLRGYSKSYEYSYSAGIRKNIPNTLNSITDVTPEGCITSLLVSERLNMFVTSVKRLFQVRRRKGKSRPSRTLAPS